MGQSWSPLSWSDADVPILPARGCAEQCFEGYPTDDESSGHVLMLSATAARPALALWVGIANSILAVRKS